MKGFPRIHSISTVGIRQHNNADYKLHAVRTDFTGNNGLGKSIIADLLQLIFVPLRDEWKPGTEGLEDRKLENIPLKKDWITHAFAFLNIEKKPKEFLTIGVFIPRTSRLPVRPFIIQASEDFETRGLNLKTFSYILQSSDFVDEDLRIFDLQQLGRKLFSKYQLFLKDFYHRAEISEYYELLYRNKLIPIDLSKEQNLKSFAKVLQSFSRAKTLDIKKSKSLQDFLFEENEDIKANYENQKENLAQHIRNYHNADHEIRTLARKQDRLTHLKQTFDRYSISKEDYLLKNAHLCWTKMKNAAKEYDENDFKQKKAFDEYEKAKSEFEKISVEHLKNALLQRDICNEIRTKLEDQKTGAGKSNLESLKKKRQSILSLVEELEDLTDVVNGFDSLEDLCDGFKQYENKKIAVSKLTDLTTHPLYKKFIASKWSESYVGASEFYKDRLMTLDSSIATLSEIAKFYDSANPDSLFSWAVKEATELTVEQETILYNFKEIYVRKIVPAEGTKYTLDPAKVLSSFTRESDGIWVHLGPVSHFFPLITSRLFNNKTNLAAAIQRKKEEVQSEMNLLAKEREEISELNEALINIGFNENYYNLFAMRGELEDFVINKKFNDQNLEFIENHYEDFSKIKLYKEEAASLDQNITKIIEDISRIEGGLSANDEALTELLTEEFHDLNREVNQPFDKILLDSNCSIEILIGKRNELKKQIKAEERYRRSVKQKRDEQKGILEACKNRSTSLLLTKKTTEVSFHDAKIELELNTERNFDSSLVLGEVNDEVVDKLNVNYLADQRSFESEYASVANAFEESRAEKGNPEIYNENGIPYYSFKALVNVLCGKIGLDGLTKELSQLNDHLKSLGELQLKILTEVFTQVEKQYRHYATIIISLNFFFEKNKVSDMYNFKVEFEPRKDINIDWIQKMKDKARVYKYGADLFTKIDDLPSEQNSPENLIRNIAKQFYAAVDTDPLKLLDPKFYFTLKVRMEDEDGETNTASGGQAYTALALLCIGRLSIVQKDQDLNPGVKFIIIEELSNIDDTNFNIFPDIAKQFGYQLITMTPKPFGSYNDEEWYLHMLIKNGKDKYRNYTPMSFFKTRFNNIPLTEYITQNELASN